MNGKYDASKQTNTEASWPVHRRRLPAARCSLPAPKRVDVDMAIAVAIAGTVSRAGPIAVRCHAVSGAGRKSMQAKAQRWLAGNNGGAARQCWYPDAAPLGPVMGSGGRGVVAASEPLCIAQEKLPTSQIS